MTTKILGVTVVPIEDSLAKAFRTILFQKKTSFLQPPNWSDFPAPAEGRVHPIEGRSQNDGILLDSIWGRGVQMLSTDIATVRDNLRVTPEAPGVDASSTYFYQQFYVMDTDFGRQVVLYWKDRTIPLLSWEAKDEDIEAYIDLIDKYRDELIRKVEEGRALREKSDEKKGPRPHTLRRWDNEIECLLSWQVLLTVGKNFRNNLKFCSTEAYHKKIYSLRSWRYGEYHAERLDREGPVTQYEFRQDPPKGHKIGKVDFKLHDLVKDLHIVGNQYYYKDVSLCHTRNNAADLDEYARGCARQAEIAEAKYKVTGDPDDRRYCIEKRLRAKINSSLSFKLAKGFTDFRESKESKRLLQEYKKATSLEGSLLITSFQAACHKAYMEFYQLNGRYRPPLTVEELLAQKLSGFDLVKASCIDKTRGIQDTSVFQSIDGLELELDVPNEIHSDMLADSLPMRRTRGCEAFVYWKGSSCLTASR